MAGQHGRHSPPDFWSAASAESSDVWRTISDGGGGRPVVCDHMQSRRTGPSACSDPEHSHDVHEQRKLSQRARVVAVASADSATVSVSQSVHVSIALLSQGDHGGVSKPHSEYESSASNKQPSSLFTSSATPFRGASMNCVMNISTTWCWYIQDAFSTINTNTRLNHISPRH